MPRCSARIRFDTQRQDFERSFGAFVFESRDVAASIEHRIRESPSLANRFDGQILAWIQSRDDTLSEPVSLLERHRDFGSIADDLLRAGHGQAHCALCDVDCAASALARNDDGVGPGWRFNRWLCPAGHPLLVTEWAHFMMRRPDLEAG
jgi:hypothetical protein